MEVTDHATVYAVPDEGLAPDVVLGPPLPDESVLGTAECHIGDDPYLGIPSGQLLLIDTRTRRLGATPNRVRRSLHRHPNSVATTYESDALF